MPVSKSDLQFYLTSVIPEVEQTIRSQSLGGYAATVGSDLSTSLVYPQATITRDSGRFDSSIFVSSINGVSESALVDVNGEVMKANSVVSAGPSIALQVERSVNNVFAESTCKAILPAICRFRCLTTTLTRTLSSTAVLL